MAPDRRKHRGPHPRDRVLFGEPNHAVLRQAVNEFSWLLTRQYPPRATLKLVGDRHALTSRQRQAVLCCGCSDQALTRLGRTAVEPEQCKGQPIGIDGYNLLITLESALSGGLVLIGRDGRFRDLASVHGSYRSVLETNRALEWMLETVRGLLPSRVDFYLDQPVSNSGRLKCRLAGLLEQTRSGDAPPWNIELVSSPDRILKSYDGVVVTTDSVILRHCRQNLNLAGLMITNQADRAWVLDLGQTFPGGCGVYGRR